MNANQFSHLSAENETSRLAQIGVEEIYSEGFEILLTQIAKPIEVEIISENWGTEENPQPMFCLYKVGESFVTPFQACHSEAAAIAFARRYGYTIKTKQTNEC